MIKSIYWGFSRNNERKRKFKGTENTSKISEQNDFYAFLQM